MVRNHVGAESLKYRPWQFYFGGAISMTHYETLQIGHLEEHIGMLRSKHLVDILDVAAYAIVKVWSWAVLVLRPIGWITSLIIWGVIFLPILRLLVLVILDLLWHPMLGILLGTSWLWFRVRLLRPLLILPGILTAMIASSYLTIVGVEREQYARFQKLSLAEDWPLTWFLMKYRSPGR